MPATATGQEPAPVPCAEASVPPAGDLTTEQWAGRACYACGRPLTTGAVYRGWARGRLGAHSLDAEVWACPQ
ncbi:hypothetical protein KQY30_25030 [Streptomyces sp. GMY02]|uniref:hypothetical protein n=1 Tax=Streptomyces sp. GMY02 TaxID=1333528 RepID=UPI001C2CA53A|nr:hypothetical protein [Streptomyces sp. GMY02]QXE36990.1 hypothetical protein KQY30_25030 [Streptomyces sp. GMY02]